MKAKSVNESFETHEEETVKALKSNAVKVLEHSEEAVEKAKNDENIFIKILYNRKIDDEDAIFCDDKYAINRDGVLYSLCSNSFIKPHISTKSKYAEMTHRIEGKRKYEELHKLVAAVFVSARAVCKGYIVHHVDLNVKNNNYSNLQVMTGAEHRKLHAELRRKAREQK